MILIVAMTAVSCTTATLHQSDGRLSGRYSLEISAPTGPIAELVMRSAIAEAFIENGVAIDSTADERLSCSCNMSTSQLDYAIFAISAYNVFLRCSTSNASFDVHATSRVLMRFFTTLTLGLILDASIPPYIVLGGIVIDLLILSNADSAYRSAMAAAVTQAVTK